MWTAVAAVSVVTILLILRRFFRPGEYRSQYVKNNTCLEDHWQFEGMKEMVKNYDIEMPAMFIDLDVFDHNVRKLADIVSGSGKKLRLATKSIRCPALIRRALEIGGNNFKGLMCYSVQEAGFLADQGFDDLFVAYPTVQYTDVVEALRLIKAGKALVLTIDSISNIGKIDLACRRAKAVNVKIRVAVDLDMRTPIMPLIKVGAHRSVLNSMDKLHTLWKESKKSNNIEIVAMIGYEAVVAGVPDYNRYSAIPGFIINWLKRKSQEHAVQFRQETTGFCRDHNIALQFFNGGGTGSLQDACADPSLTEVSAGSGFLQGHLFDNYSSNQCLPAAVYALQITRLVPNILVCQGGGFIASGTLSEDKLPLPICSPIRTSLNVMEGYGEVQTTFTMTGRTGAKGAVGQGDPFLFRPAKSGEIAERFNVYHLKRGYDIVEIVKTYRGEGRAFH